MHTNKKKRISFLYILNYIKAVLLIWKCINIHIIQRIVLAKLNTLSLYSNSVFIVFHNPFFILLTYKNLLS